MNINFLNSNFNVKDNYVFSLPKNIYLREFFGYFLIISPDNGSWLVLNTELQVEIFNCFYAGNSIQETLEKYSDHSEDVTYVIAKILGKHLEIFFDRRNYHEAWTLRIYLTNKCNLRCQHCFMFAGEALEKELSIDEVVTAIRICQSKGANKVVFTGGEVVLSDAFVPALKEAKRLNLFTQVLTNGTLWNENLIKDTSPYIDHIQISIDGFDEYSNAVIRGPGVFNKALLTVSKFVEKGVKTSIAVTPTYELAFSHADKYVKFAQSMVEKFGEKNFSIIFSEDLLNGRNVSVSEKENERYSEIISAISEQIYPNYNLTVFVNKHRHNNVLLNCGYGFLTLCSNGDFSFCSSNLKKYGNIRAMSWEEIFRFREKARSFSMVDSFVPCNTCELRFICGGGCRQRNMPAVTKIDNLKEINCFSGKAICDRKRKEMLYRMMVESDDFLVW